MGRITTDQSHQIIGTLIANAQWSEIDFDDAGLQDAVIRNPREAGRRFTEWLKNGAHTIVPLILSVFKTIKVGTGGIRTADDFREALQRVGCKIEDKADDLMSKSGFIAADQEGDVDLLVLTTSQLTGQDDVSTTDVFAGAARIGLEKCQPEDGPRLRMQYLDQPLNTWLVIGMEPITGSDGVPRVFLVLCRLNGLWLSAGRAKPGRWSGESRWVFRRRKSSQDS